MKEFLVKTEKVMDEDEVVGMRHMTQGGPWARERPLGVPTFFNPPKFMFCVCWSEIISRLNRLKQSQEYSPTY